MLKIDRSPEPRWAQGDALNLTGSEVGVASKCLFMNFTAEMRWGEIFLLGY